MTLTCTHLIFHRSVLTQSFFQIAQGYQLSHLMSLVRTARIILYHQQIDLILVPVLQQLYLLFSHFHRFFAQEFL